MMNPKKDLMQLKEYTLAAAKDHSIELYGKVQLLCNFVDMVSSNVRFEFKPLIGTYPWPKEMVQKLCRPPVGLGEGTGLGGGVVYYDVQFTLLSPELRARRGKILSAMRGSKIAYEHLKPWLDVKRHLDSCKEEMGKTTVVEVSSVVKAIDERLGPIEAEIKKQEKIIRALRPEGEEDRNELLCRDIARSLGIEEGPNLVLRFHTINYAYPLPIKGILHHPVGCT